jgi:hypothetical protein
MKTKKRNKKIQLPAYADGLAGKYATTKNITAAGSYLAQTAAPFIEDATASSALTGAASGAAAGATFGPVGAVVGGVVGGAAGFIGGNAAKNKQQKALQLYRNQQQIGYGKAQAALMQQEFYGNNPIGNTYANGGTTGNQMAWVNHDEIIQYPNGDTKQVKSKTKQTDDVLTSLPYGTNIFGGLNFGGKSFAEYATKVHKNNKKAEKDGGRYAKNSIKLNDRRLREVAKLQEDRKTRETGKTVRNGYYTGVTDLGKENPDYEDLQERDAGSDTGEKPNKWDRLYDLGANLSQMAPIVYNMQQWAKGPEKVAPITNPYGGAILSTMGKRRFNDRALMDTNRRASRIANYNANNVTGTGQNMAYRLANEANSRAGLYDTIAQTQNMDNQYLADYANTLNSLGQQHAAAKSAAQDINMRNKGAAQNHLSAAVGQLSQLGQQRNVDRKKAKRDAALLQAIQPYLKHGADANTLQLILGGFQ